MGNRRSSEIMRCLSQAFGSASMWVAFDALATPVPTACGDLLFSTEKKVGKKCRSQTPRGLHSAKRFVGRTTCVGLQSDCKMEVGCETALRAVRDRFIGGSFGMAFLLWLF